MPLYVTAFDVPTSPPLAKLADHVRACVDRGVTDAVLGRPPQAAASPSCLHPILRWRETIETFLTEVGSGPAPLM